MSRRHLYKLKSSASYLGAQVLWIGSSSGKHRELCFLLLVPIARNREKTNTETMRKKRKVRVAKYHGTGRKNAKTNSSLSCPTNKISRRYSSRCGSGTSYCSMTIFTHSISSETSSTMAQSSNASTLAISAPNGNAPTISKTSTITAKGSNDHILVSSANRK